MKALSIRQPWAWLVVHGPKRMAREIARYTLLTVGARGEPVHVEHVPDLAELADARIVVGGGTAVVA